MRLDCDRFLDHVLIRISRDFSHIMKIPLKYSVKRNIFDFLQFFPLSCPLSSGIGNGGEEIYQMSVFLTNGVSHIFLTLQNYTFNIPSTQAHTHTQVNARGIGL
jgi:hypothetical protein